MSPFSSWTRSPASTPNCVRGRRRPRAAGLCPKNDESAGKRRSTRLRKSGTWLKTTLVTAAWAAVRVKASYLRAQFMRIKARRGPKKAIIAVAASMLTATYFMLRDGIAYRDLGPAHFDQRHRDNTIRRLIVRLNDLGYQIPAPAASINPNHCIAPAS